MERAKLVSCFVPPTASVREVWQALDTSTLQIALVTDEDGHLLGLINDGDIRRALLGGKSLGSKAAEIMNDKPFTFRAGQTKNYVIRQMQKHSINQAPLLDDEGKVVDLYILKNLLLREARENLVVLMAGGLGTRLRPLTADTPKPLLKVGNKPILETIIGSFIDCGFYRFCLAVNYKSEQIEAYFGDGTAWDAEITYLRESKRLGTAGALSLLPTKPQADIIVMNGDLLTKVDFAEFLDYHRRERATATMGVREYSWQIPYGVIDVADGEIKSITEKPMQSCYVNAGLYALSPDAVEKVAAEEYLDMPNLFQTFIEARAKTSAYPIRDYWLDIGRMDDFRQAQNDYGTVFGA